MNISVFVSIWISGMSSINLANDYIDQPLSLLTSNSAVSAVEFYTPEVSDEPVHDMDELTPPALIVEINLDSAADAELLVNSPAFRKAFTDKSRFANPAERIDVEILEKMHFNLPGHDSPPARTAPMSFVVRYYGPFRDGSDFIDYYINHHPQIAAKFPGIRNVLCYLPLDWRNMDKIDDETMLIGNEVVFDDLESFKAALASDVFTELRADGKKFESWGYSSHHAMHREAVYTRK